MPKIRIRKFWPSGAGTVPGVLLIALALGCVGHRAKFADETFLSDEAEIRSAVEPLPPKAQLVYLVLAGELAGQRGRYEVALEHYLQAARLSRDGRLAERATQIALFIKKYPEAIESVALWLKAEPRHAGARRMATLLYLKEGRRDEAVTQMKVLLTLPDADLENTLI